MNTINEIIATLSHNKLRTFLTGLSVSWGIFILIILMSAGNGLKNGVTSNFSSRATNTVQMWPGVTSIPYKGLKSGRNMNLTEKESDALNKLPETGEKTNVVETNVTISFGSESGSYQLKGVDPTYNDIFKLEINSGNGRFINTMDLKSNSKVIVLDRKIVETLFKGKNALGEYVKVGDIMFKIVGINTKKERFDGSQAYIPFSTAQMIYKPDKKLSTIALTVNGLETKDENDKFNDKLKSTVSPTMMFDPKDEKALWIWNSQRDYIETMKIFNGISIFVTIVGILTLIAGIVGVSNIMLVSVKERTREFGIRKAIGATPGSILRSIIVESILITAIFGYLGMMAGISLSEIVNFIMEKGAAAAANSDGPQMSVFKNPTVDLKYVFFATLILIIAGVIAGYMPARRAVRIKPIEAMREE
ncbi:conserved membrane hypothetical protein [uncultured Paludibacter sp.]|nr:conserved membrane hypothetical protein [uncultured Paludibacter sp.]